MTRHKQQQHLDRVAVAMSSLCVAHCLLGPLSIVLLPVLATCGLSDEVFHRLLVFFVLPTSVSSLVLGCSRHRDSLVLVFGALGLAALVLSAVVGHALFGEFGERIVTLVAGLTTASAHVRNSRLCQHHSCHNE